MRWDAQLYQTSHAFVFELAAGILDALGPRAGERILDVGCGSGQLTAKIAEAGCDVVGIDSSTDMIASARSSFPSIDWRVMDATAMTFNSEFDAVFSNAALHWIHPPRDAADGIRRALKPGGRFVAEFGARGNIKTIADAIRDVCAERGIELDQGWYYPSIAEYATLLESVGMRPVRMETFARPTPLNGGAEGMAQWLRQFRGPLLARHPGSIEEIVERVRPALWDGESWIADYVRIRVMAFRDDH